MLVTFKSRATADVIMFGKDARRLLKIMGKDTDDTKGIVTLEQMPTAIRKLRQAIEEEKQALAEKNTAADQDDDSDDTSKPGAGIPVNLAQRAWPLLEALEIAQKEKQPLIWESS